MPIGGHSLNSGRVFRGLATDNRGARGATALVAAEIEIDSSRDRRSMWSDHSTSLMNRHGVWDYKTGSVRPRRVAGPEAGGSLKEVGEGALVGLWGNCGG